MSYTNAFLFSLGVLGILLHNLIKLDELNRKLESKFSFRAYISRERFTILISFLVVLIAVFVKLEIKELDYAGKWLGVSFVAIGYMGQSLVLTVIKRIRGKVDAPVDQEDKAPDA